MDILNKLRPYATMNETDIRNIACLAVNDWTPVWMPRKLKGLHGAYSVDKDVMVVISQSYDVTTTLMTGRKTIPTLNQAEIIQYLQRRRFL